MLSSKVYIKKTLFARLIQINGIHTFEFCVSIKENSRINATNIKTDSKEVSLAHFFDHFLHVYVSINYLLLIFASAHRTTDILHVGASTRRRGRFWVP